MKFKPVQDRKGLKRAGKYVRWAGRDAIMRPYNADGRLSRHELFGGRMPVMNPDFAEIDLFIFVLTIE